MREDIIDNDFKSLIQLGDKFEQIEKRVLTAYKDLVSRIYQDKVSFWPILSGYNYTGGTFGDWIILIFEHTGRPGHIEFAHLGEFSAQAIGDSSIDDQNLNTVRVRIQKQYNLKASDAVLFLKREELIDTELHQMLQRHEVYMGLAPMKVFLSHKRADKPLVREFKEALLMLGFDPWLDEDALNAGMELERGILKGFKDSCAAIFFITPNFTDDDYLATEVDYAIAEKRAKGERFAIITLVLDTKDQRVNVPELLMRYAWKKPATQLEALREILKALPIKVGNIYWKH